MFFQRATHRPYIHSDGIQHCFGDFMKEIVTMRSGEEGKRVQKKFRYGESNPGLLGESEVC